MGVQTTLLHGARANLNNTQDILAEIKGDWMYEIALLDDVKDRIQAELDELENNKVDPQ